MPGAAATAAVRVCACTPQSLSASPYLDPHLFTYSKHISPIQGLRNSPLEPLRFRHARSYRLHRDDASGEQAPTGRGQQAGGAAGRQQQRQQWQPCGDALTLEPAQPQSVVWGSEVVPRRQLHLFHPTDPFVLTVVQTIAQPAAISICHRV